MAAGKFQGVISTQTPIGGCWTRIRLEPDGETDTSPMIRTASSEYQRKNSAAYATSPRASARALPFSREMRWAICSLRSVIRSKQRLRISARRRGGVAAHSGRAAAAASTAARPSSASASAMSVITEASEGLITSTVSLLLASCQFPAISSWRGTARPSTSSGSWVERRVISGP
jgi:hypothetical protein